MGILFLQQGKPDMALSYFQKSIDADKNYDVAYRNLAAVYMQMSKSEQDANQKLNYNHKAKEAIEKAVEISPNPISLLALSRIHLREGNFEQALALSDKVDKIEPANKNVYQIKKLALEGLGRFEEARDAHNSYLIFSGQQGVLEKDGPPPPDED